MSFDYLLVWALQLVPIGTVFYLGWRLVRALELRKGANLRVIDLTKEVQAIRTEVTMMSGELTELRNSTGSPSGRLTSGLHNGTSNP